MQRLTLATFLPLLSASLHAIRPAGAPWSIGAMQCHHDGFRLLVFGPTPLTLDFAPDALSTDRDGSVLTVSTDAPVPAWVASLLTSALTQLTPLIPAPVRLALPTPRVRAVSGW